MSHLPIRSFGMLQRFPMTRLIFLLCLLVPAAKAQFFGGEPIGGSNGPVSRFPGPQSCRDSATGITFYVRDIYLTPPGTTGCGLTRVSNGAGPVCTAC